MLSSALPSAIYRPVPPGPSQRSSRRRGGRTGGIDRALDAPGGAQRARLRFGPGHPASPGARVPTQPIILTVAVGPPAAAGRCRRAAIARLRRSKCVTRNERPVNDSRPSCAAARLRHIEPAVSGCPAGGGRAGGRAAAATPRPRPSVMDRAGPDGEGCLLLGVSSAL